MNPEQVIEMAQYIDTRKGASPAEGLTAESEKLLDSEAREEALKKIVDASAVLSGSPERGLSPSQAIY